MNFKSNRPRKKYNQMSLLSITTEGKKVVQILSTSTKTQNSDTTDYKLIKNRCAPILKDGT